MDKKISSLAISAGKQRDHERAPQQKPASSSSTSNSSDYKPISKMTSEEIKKVKSEPFC